MKIVIATTNEGKLREFRQILSPLGFEAVSLRDVGVSADIAEDGDSFEENARIKAQTVYDLVKTPVIADDSGLCVDFLDGAPGIYSARYGGEELDDTGRVEKLLQELENVPEPLRGAEYVCAIYAVMDEKTEFVVTAKMSGIIGTEPVGDGGFGYDPIFILGEEYGSLGGKSVAQISAEEKHKISHRGKAAVLLAEKLKELGYVKS